MSHLSRIQLFSNYLTYLELIKKKSSLKARKIVTEVMGMEVQGYQRDSIVSLGWMRAPSKYTVSVLY